MADRFWILGTGNFEDTDHWSTSSGGSGGASVPTDTDDVFIDANSGTSGFTITINSDVSTNNIDTTGSNSHTIHIVDPFGFFTATGSVCTFTASCTITFSAGSLAYISFSGDVTFAGSVGSATGWYFDSVNLASVTFTSMSTLVSPLSSGTINLRGNVTFQSGATYVDNGADFTMNYSGGSVVFDPNGIEFGDITFAGAELLINTDFSFDGTLTINATTTRPNINNDVEMTNNGLIYIVNIGSLLGVSASGGKLLTISGTGDIQIAGGTLGSTGVAWVLNSTGAIATLSSSTVNLGTGNQSVGAYIDLGGATLAAEGAIITLTNGNTGDYFSPLSGAVIFESTGTITGTLNLTITATETVKVRETGTGGINNLVINNSSAIVQKRVLGDSFTIGGALTITAGTYALLGTTTVTGTTSITGSITATGASANLTANGAVTVNSGGVLGSNSAWTFDCNAALTINSGGTFNAPNASGTWDKGASSGSVTFSAGSAFNHNNGTYNLSSATGFGTFPNGAIFYDINIPSSAGTHAFFLGGGQNVTIQNSITISSGKTFILSYTTSATTSVITLGTTTSSFTASGAGNIRFIRDDPVNSHSLNITIKAASPNWPWFFSNDIVSLYGSTTDGAANSIISLTDGVIAPAVSTTSTANQIINCNRVLFLGGVTVEAGDIWRATDSAAVEADISGASIWLGWNPTARNSGSRKALITGAFSDTAQTYNGYDFRKKAGATYTIPIATEVTLTNCYYTQYPLKTETDATDLLVDTNDGTLVVTFTTEGAVWKATRGGFRTGSTSANPAINVPENLRILG